MKIFLHKIFLYITVLIAFALAASYLSVYISPVKIWWFAFVGLAFPYLLLANLISLLLWLISHKPKVVWIPLITLILGWGHISKVVQISLKKTPDADTASFKLLTYNVRAFDVYKWTKSDSAGFAIFDLIQKAKPQIICFQEFVTDSRTDFSFANIEKKLSDTPHKHYYGQYTNGDRKFMGLAIYSSFPIIKRGVIPFENTHNASIYCDIVVYCDTIRVYNNHLQSIRLGTDNYAFLNSIKWEYTDEQIQGIKDISIRLRDAFIIRAKQAERIKEHAATCPYPVIICGDFNDTPISYTYHILKNGLKDAFIESGSGIGNTYIGKLPSFRIDYILYSKELESSGFEKLKAVLSDHFPLTCKIDLKGEQ